MKSLIRNLDLETESKLGPEVYKTRDGKVLKAYGKGSKPQKWIVTEELALKLLGGLNSPKFVDSGYSENCFHIVKKFIPGTDLECLMETGELDDNDSFWDKIKPMFKGFESSGVVFTNYSHLKNIIKSEDGEPYVIDLGVAVFLKDKVNAYFEKSGDNFFKEVVDKHVSGIILDKPEFDKFAKESLEVIPAIKDKAYGKIKGFFWDNSGKLRVY